ncbi:MAG: alpha/beta hydrolase [Nitrososphaerota archaeon]|nr:alpha/beta hydrolase [Nitrososphaerota archaeon]
MITHSVSSHDGRVLKVVEDGDRNGKPVFALHGTPGSFILYGPHIADATRRGIRLISYDRAGYGESSPHPGRRVADEAKDIEAIADSLGMERFAVWGISGGGPHALACAVLLPRRVAAAASLASPAPYPSPGLDWLAGQGEDNVAEFTASMAGPEKLSAYLEPLREGLLAASPGEVATMMESLIPPVDKEVMAGELGLFLVSNMRAGLSRGIAGWRDDDMAFVADWGFRPSAASVPILLWQGRHDKMVPFAHGQWLSERISGAEARLTAEDGHLTLLERRVPETHAWLLKYL